MIHSFQELVDSVKNANRRIAVAVAQDAEVLIAVRKAADLGIVKPVLVGEEAAIKSIAAEINVSLDGMEIIDEADKIEACRKAVKLVHDGDADVVMKGIVDTSVILKAVLDKDIGLRESPVLSHVALFGVDGFDRLLYITDAAMCIAPDVEQKAHIIGNAVKVAHALGNENPIVTCLCAVEKVNPKMQATLDAAELVERNKRGEIAGCTVCGPLALDNAVSVEAAKHKGITDPNAGKADILLVPYIEAGNIFYKSLTYMAKAQNAGMIVGAKAPVVVTSRADSDETKLNSIALAIAVAAKNA
ncbi:MAG: phosphate butyryltransferase [Clostridia bacterium]|nr:phosphate butyryltransferase [Clostridia bacterium]MBR2329150.1 phosphate butyryltransferase [Clostridia bacterium]